MYQAGDISCMGTRKLFVSVGSSSIKQPTIFSGHDSGLDIDETNAAFGVWREILQHTIKPTHFWLGMIQAWTLIRQLWALGFWVWKDSTTHLSFGLTLDWHLIDQCNLRLTDSHQDNWFDLWQIKIKFKNHYSLFGLWAGTCRWWAQNVERSPHHICFMCVE